MHQVKDKLYPTISINDPDFKNLLINSVKDYGVCVIENVLDDEESDSYTKEILDSFVDLGSGIDLSSIEETWIPENLPPQTRTGLFQSLVTNTQPVWNLRSNENVRLIFKILYSHFMKKEINDFYCSGDGINVNPPHLIAKSNSKDWPHIDQTCDGIFKCFQGQMVLTNTTASFVCTPKSHKFYNTIIKKLGKEYDISNWLMFSNKEVDIIKNTILKNCNWQIPILCKKGSFIVWTSTLIHSARLQQEFTKKKGDIYHGWRCVVYICYRPKEDVEDEAFKIRWKLYEENRVSNHWGTKMFPKKYRFHNRIKYNDVINRLINSPQDVYKILGKPILDETQIDLMMMMKTI